VLTPEVTERTWAALCDPTSAVHGLVAEQEDHLAGLAHLVLYPTTWAMHPTCYLEDRCVAKPCRGGDVAHRLIEAVYAFADGFGPASVYWLTQEYNAPARSPIRQPRSSDIVRRIPALSLREDSARYGRRRRLPEADPLRDAEAEIAVLAGFPSSTCPRRSTSHN
jgi:Acetyltransferase (GNAT) family